MSFQDWVYRITCEAQPSGVSGKAVNTYHVAGPVSLSDAILGQVLNDIKALYTAGVSYLQGTWTIGSRVLELHTGGTPPRIRNVAAVTQTLTASSPQPAQLAAVMSWKTDLAGPAYRGRTFFGGLNAAALTGQSLNGVFTSAMNAAAATAITAISGHTGFGGGLVIRSNVQQTDTFVVAGTMNTKIDTLRRRA